MLDKKVAKHGVPLTLPRKAPSQMISGHLKGSQNTPGYESSCGWGSWKVLLRFTDRLCKSRWSHCGFGTESENIKPETCGLFLDRESHTWWVEKWHSSLDNNGLLQIRGWNWLQSFIPEHRNRVSQWVRQRATRKLTIPRRQITTSLLSLFICTHHILNQLICLHVSRFPPAFPSGSWWHLSLRQMILVGSPNTSGREDACGQPTDVLGMALWMCKSESGSMSDKPVSWPCTPRSL